MNRLRRATTSFILLTMLCGLNPSVIDSAGSAHADTTWTIMVYMADDTTSPLPWEDNINAMEAATQAPGTSILALVDPPGTGNSQILKIVQDPDPQSDTIVSPAIDDGHAVIPIDNEVNMADPSTLQAFIAFAIGRYPATHTVLILWGHGGGWRGLCQDGYDLLTLPELRSALASAATTMGRPLDIIAVDACAGATLEMLCELFGYSDYLVASENNVPSQGLPYTQVLGALASDTEQSAEQFSSKIVQDYFESAWTSSPYSTTMAAFNLSRMRPMFDHLSELSTIGSKYEGIFHSSLNDALTLAEHYDTGWYVDFGDLMDCLQGYDHMPLEVRTVAIETALAYKANIINFAKFDNPDPADGIHVERASGAIIYASSGTFPDDTYGALQIAGTPWYNFSIATRRTAFTSEKWPGPVLNYSDSPVDNDSLADSATLTWPVSHSSVEAWVFRQEPGGSVLCDKLTSTTQVIEVSGFIGHFMIAASASDDGVAVTYDELRVTLHGTAQMTVLVMKDGHLSQSTYELRIAAMNYTRFLPAQNGVLRTNLSIPTDVDIGDMMVVEVRSPGSERVLGSTYVVVQPTDTMTEVNVFSPEGRDSGTFVLVFFSVLPGLLVLLFALLMYRERAQQKG